MSEHTSDARKRLEAQNARMEAAQAGWATRAQQAYAQQESAQAEASKQARQAEEAKRAGAAATQWACVAHVSAAQRKASRTSPVAARRSTTGNTGRWGRDGEVPSQLWPETCKTHVAAERTANNKSRGLSTEAGEPVRPPEVRIWRFPVERGDRVFNALLNQGYLVNVGDDGTITATRPDTVEWEHPVTIKGKVHEDGTIAWSDAAAAEKVLFAARIKELQARIDATTYNRA